MDIMEFERHADSSVCFENRNSQIEIILQLLSPSENIMNTNCECRKTLANDSFLQLGGNLILGIVKLSYKEISLGASD